MCSDFDIFFHSIYKSIWLVFLSFELSLYSLLYSSYVLEYFMESNSWLSLLRAVRALIQIFVSENNNATSEVNFPFNSKRRSFTVDLACKCTRKFLSKVDVKGKRMNIFWTDLSWFHLMKISWNFNFSCTNNSQLYKSWLIFNLVL